MIVHQVRCHSPPQWGGISCCPCNGQVIQQFKQGAFCYMISFSKTVKTVNIYQNLLFSLRWYELSVTSFQKICEAIKTLMCFSCVCNIRLVPPSLKRGGQNILLQEQLPPYKNRSTLCRILFWNLCSIWGFSSYAMLTSFPGQTSWLEALSSPMLICSSLKEDHKSKH